MADEVPILERHEAQEVVESVRASRPWPIAGEQQLEAFSRHHLAEIGLGFHPGVVPAIGSRDREVLHAREPSSAATRCASACSCCASSSSVGIGISDCSTAAHASPCVLSSLSRSANLIRALPESPHDPPHELIISNWFEKIGRAHV